MLRELKGIENARGNIVNMIKTNILAQFLLKPTEGNRFMQLNKVWNTNAFCLCFYVCATFFLILIIKCHSNYNVVIVCENGNREPCLRIFCHQHFGNFFRKNLIKWL